jgi:hypothetical protein
MSTTFSGPVISQNGFINLGSGSVINVANGTNTLALTVADYSGRVIKTNDATLAITLPTITTATLGATYTIFVETTAASLISIATDGTDKYVGSVSMIDTDSSGVMSGFAPAAANDFINMNGTTTGGIAGSVVVITALALNKYLVQGTLLGSGSIATPFANS